MNENKDFERKYQVYGIFREKVNRDFSMYSKFHTGSKACTVVWSALLGSKLHTRISVVFSVVEVPASIQALTIVNRSSGVNYLA